MVNNIKEYIIFLTLILFITLGFVSNNEANASLPAGLKTSSNVSSITKKASRLIKRGRLEAALQSIMSAGNKDAADYIKWKLYLNDNYDASFTEVANFITRHPNWPKMEQLEKRAAQLMDDNLNYNEKLYWFKHHPPKSGIGKKKLAELYIAINQQSKRRVYSNKTINSLLKEAWIEGNFNKNDELDFLERHSRILSTQDHIKRVDRLIWNKRIEQAKNILHKIPSGKRKLYNARIKLIRNSYGIDKAIKQVPQRYANDTGLIYDRMMWRHKKKLKPGTKEMMYKIINHDDNTYSHLWWKIIDMYARELIEEKRYKAAYNLIKRHNQVKNAPLSESEWLAGWIALRHLNSPNLAYKHFLNMYEAVSYPISKAKASYWMARALESNKQDKDAQKMYNYSARYFNTFYGQLSRGKLKTNANFSFPVYPNVSRQDKIRYENNQLMKVANILSAIDSNDAKIFVNHAMKTASTEGEMVMISRFGQNINSPYISLLAAKKAWQKDVVLWGSLYPTIDKSIIKHAPPELVMSIIRQESQFNPKAKSGAGAVGMMQLMPSTARYVSKKLRMYYSQRKLQNSPQYNIRLGSFYIYNLIKRYDNSFILAIASYNAGQGNVNKWINRMGDPRKYKHTHSIVDWIEQIPFPETRNYVQRVMESKQVYAALLNDNNYSLRSNSFEYNLAQR